MRTKVNVLTCDTLTLFVPHQFHKFFLVKSLICKIHCSHMWVHWLYLSHISFTSFFLVVSYRLFVVFNNANAVSAEMWVWGFGNHAWNKSLLSSHSSATRDLTILLYHLWFPKPHTHISYSQHLHNGHIVRRCFPTSRTNILVLFLLSMQNITKKWNWWYCRMNQIMTKRLGATW